MGIGYIATIEFSALKEGSAFAQTEPGSKPLGERSGVQVIGVSGKDSRVYYLIPYAEITRTITEMMKAKTTPNMGILPSEESFLPDDLIEAYRQITGCSTEPASQQGT